LVERGRVRDGLGRWGRVDRKVARNACRVWENHLEGGPGERALRRELRWLARIGPPHRNTSPDGSNGHEKTVAGSGSQPLPVEVRHPVCDTDPELVAWFMANIEKRRGDTTWRIDDHAGPPKIHKNEAGDLTVLVSANDVIAEDAAPVLRRLMLGTLTARAELDGTPPPPGTVPLG